MLGFKVAAAYLATLLDSRWACWFCRHGGWRRRRAGWPHACNASVPHRELPHSTAMIALSQSAGVMLTSGLVFGAFFVFMAATLGMWSLELFQDLPAVGFRTGLSPAVSRSVYGTYPRWLADRPLGTWRAVHCIGDVLRCAHHSPAAAQGGATGRRVAGLKIFNRSYGTSSRGIWKKFRPSHHTLWSQLNR